MPQPSSDEVLSVLDVLARYGHLVDARAWSRLDEVFAHHAVLDAQYHVATGLEEIASYLDSFGASRTHLSTNTVVRADERGLRALSKFLVILPDNAMVTGDYVDRFALTHTGRPLLAHRQINLRNRQDRTPDGEAWRVESLDRW